MSQSIGRKRSSTHDITKRKFIHWVQERDCIRHLKESGLPAPWTSDPVFQTTYFCNVRREDDRVTRYIRQKYDSQAGLARPEFNMMMARFVNKPSTLEALGWPWKDWHKSKWHEVMQNPGAWGSAYIVSTNGRKQSKHTYIAELLEQALERFAGTTGGVMWPSCKVAHGAIQAVPGFGSFMAAQVVADLKNTAGHPLQEAEDWWTFAAPGPGSLRGLTWFHDEKITPSKFMDALVSARQWVNNIDSNVVGGICNQDLQNCFCEFDKYMRVSMGTGRSKRRYNGT